MKDADDFVDGKLKNSIEKKILFVKLLHDWLRVFFFYFRQATFFLDFFFHVLRFMLILNIFW